MVARRIIVRSAERVSGSGHSFTVRTPAFQNGSGFQGKTHVRFALEWCTPIIGTQGIIPVPLSIMLCSQSISQTNSYKSWDTGNYDAILGLLQSLGGDNVFGAMADSPYVQSSICGGICDGSRLVRGGMSFYLLQGPTQFRRSVLHWAPDSINDFTFSIVFWVDEPERSIYPPFFHVWMLVRGGDDHVPVDFRTFQTDRNDGTKWQLAVSYCSLLNLSYEEASGLAITCNNLVDDPYQNLHVIGYLPSVSEDNTHYAGQKLTIKGVYEDTLGVPISRPLDNVGTIDINLQTALLFNPIPTNDVSAYVICLTFYQIPDPDPDPE